MSVRNKILVSILGVFSIIVVFYNYYVADILKYKFEADASDYIHLGLTLAKTGKYGHLNFSREEMIEFFKNGNKIDDSFDFAEYSTWRPPIWPTVIAISFIISDYSISFLLIVKFLFHLLGAFLFYKTLKYIEISKFWGLVGVFLYLFNPAWQLYSRVFLSEPITLFLITFFVWSLLRFLKYNRMIWLNGMTGGLLILSHPYYIFFPFSMWLFLLFYRKITLVKASILATFAIAIVSIWIIRNSIIMETNELLITTSSGAVLAKGWNKKVPELHTNTKGDRAEENLVLQNFEYTKSDYKGQIGTMALYRDATYKFIRTNPNLVMPIIWKKIKSAFNPFPETPRPGILEFGRVVYQIMGLIASIFLLWQGTRISKALIYGLLFSTLLITILTFSGFRFRMPQSSIEILFITIAFRLIVEKRKILFTRHE